MKAIKGVNVYPRDGRFLVRVRKTWRGEKISEAATFDSERAAYDFGRKIIEEIERGEYKTGRQKANITMKQALEDWISHIYTLDERKGLDNETRRIRLLTDTNKNKQFWLNKDITKVTDDDVHHYLLYLHNKGNAASTIRHKLQDCSNAFALETKRKKLKIDNPFKNADKPSVSKNARDKMITLSSKRILTGQSRRHKWKKKEYSGTLPPLSEFRFFISLALKTALRKSELLKLRWRDIDFNNQLLTILDPKNSISRKAPTCRHAIKIFQILKEEKKRRSLSTHDNDKIFSINASGVDSTWQRYRDRLAKTHKNNEEDLHDLRIHDLRHIAITMYAEHFDLDTSQIQLISGHVTASMVDRYRHRDASKVAKLI